MRSHNPNHKYSNYHSYEVHNFWILGNREQGTGNREQGIAMRWIKTGNQSQRILYLITARNAINRGIRQFSKKCDRISANQSVRNLMRSHPIVIQVRSQ
ncbi:hypothetical protein [Moorena bouillonii]|uniref:hypothetical protein n=1 Tax=Moorena bouillonii TaxID=207920 RepID=UPI00117EECFE|nr:hypothetical protein [Moorena bouillonii]